MATSPTQPDQSRKRRRQRLLGWAAGAALCLLLLAVVARSLLIRRMLLPRLIITQSGNVMAVAVTPNGQTIFTGDDYTSGLGNLAAYQTADVFIWDSRTGRLIRRLPGFYWRSSGVLASPDGRRVIASGEAFQNAHGITPYQVIEWDWQSGQKQWAVTGQKQWAVKGDLPLSYSADERLVGCDNGIYNATNGELICLTSKNIGEDGQSGFTPDGKWYGIVDDISLDPITHKARQTSDFEGDKQYFYSTTRLHFWHTDTGKEAKDLPFTRVRAFDIASDGQWLVMASDTGMMGGSDGSVVRRVDIQTGKVLWTRERSMNGPGSDPEAVLNSVAVSPNGKYVVLASNNSHLIVLDAQTGRELFRPFIFPSLNPPDWVMPGGLAFSADGKTLVSRCGRRTLVWDSATLQ